MSFRIRDIHWNIHLEFLCANPDLARGRLNTSQARRDYNNLWAQLAEKLNSAGFGQKPIEKWQKSWSDYKQCLKKKAAEIEKCRNMTGGGPSSNKNLTDFELKVLSLLGESFYKGIGVQEMGISHVKQSERIEPETQSYTEVDFETQSMSMLDSNLFKHHHGTHEGQENILTSSNLNPKPLDNEAPKIPFRKRPFPISSCTAEQDHDYLGSLPGPSKSRKKTCVRTSNAEDNLNKVYAETVEVLHGINTNVGKVAEHLGSLLTEVKLFRKSLDAFLGKQ